MKNQEFLSKLEKEGKIRLVEPSEEVKKAYIIKSESSLISAKILLENNRLEESVSLAYYSMYHLLISLLFKTGIKSENHTASIIFMKELFNLDNSNILEAKKERVDKQYYVDFKINKEDVERAIREAELFNSNLIDFISKLNNKDVSLYREKFTNLIKEVN
jgi:uncharacterized protein (UPF0332 family)